MSPANQPEADTAAATSKPSPPPLPTPAPAEKDYFDTLQPGLRFNPTDVELIRDYLKPKLAKSMNPFKSRIHCVNIYDHNPDELIAKYRPFLDTCWYFFTPRVRKYRHGDRPKRVARNGFWKATSADCPILHNGVKIGTKRTLVFHIKNSDERRLDNSKKTDWIMQEYRDNTEVMSIDNGQENFMLDDNVLCKIYNKKREKLQAMDDHDMSMPHLDAFFQDLIIPDVRVLEPAVNMNIHHLDHQERRLNGFDNQWEKLDHQSVALGLGFPNHFKQYMSSLEPIVNEAAGTSRQHKHHSRTQANDNAASSINFSDNLILLTSEIEIPRFKKRESLAIASLPVLEELSTKQVKRTRKSVNLLEKSMSKLSLEKEIDDSNDEILMNLMKSMEIEVSNKEASEIGWMIVTPEAAQETDGLKEGCDHLKSDDEINKSSDCVAVDDDGSNEWMIVPKE